MVDGKNYVFGSLLSRDSTYKLMLHIWRKAQRMADSDSEPPSGVQVVSLCNICVVSIVWLRESKRYKFHFSEVFFLNLHLPFQAVDDDGEDSVSGSANSLIMEDQTDGSYLVSTAINSVGSAPSPITTSPWTPDQVTATTNTTTATNNLANADNTPSVPNNSIPVNSSTSASDSVLLLGGGVLTGKGSGQEETNGTTTAAATNASDSNTSSSSNIVEWFTQGSLVKSKPCHVCICLPNTNCHCMHNKTY